MATFFGEVVVAPSRAGLDEEEEAREETPEDREIRREIEKKREIEVLWSCAEEPLVCSRFIVAIGRNAAAFLSSFILDSVCWEVVGVVKLWNEWCRTSSTTNVLPTDSFCLFYRLISDPTVLLCQCSCYVAEDQQFQWLEKVFGSMQKKGLQVTILSTCPVADYKTQESTLTLVSPFLKALKTKEFQEQVCCPLLEQPNIVRDLPAAEQIPFVLSLTEMSFCPVVSSELLPGVADPCSAVPVLHRCHQAGHCHH
ncbi:proteasome assembly chaperone 1 isoform X2 [Motacilla alba alba]|uniref:proteasome assembly chaperone 1 isoform X2 n=1 Tax=Motacilla alba alba TaxID=1094192 RepID=UPI0018D50763|nr:proteasome assembly chaperone 1 isoform X2 [Motacilla alba alba]